MAMLSLTESEKGGTRREVSAYPLASFSSPKLGPHNQPPLTCPAFWAKHCPSPEKPCAIFLYSFLMAVHCEGRRLTWGWGLEGLVDEMRVAKPRPLTA